MANKRHFPVVVRRLRVLARRAVNAALSWFAETRDPPGKWPPPGWPTPGQIHAANHDAWNMCARCRVPFHVVAGQIWRCRIHRGRLFHFCEACWSMKPGAVVDVPKAVRACERACHAQFN